MCHDDQLTTTLSISDEKSTVPFPMYTKRLQQSVKLTSKITMGFVSEVKFDGYKECREIALNDYNRQDLKQHPKCSCVPPYGLQKGHYR